MPSTHKKLLQLCLLTALIPYHPAVANTSPEPLKTCAEEICQTESDVSTRRVPSVFMKPTLSKHIFHPQSLPFAPLTGNAIIHTPTNAQIVGETFRIEATLPSDWFQNGAARGRVFYFDVSTDSFIVVSEFRVPASPGQDMQATMDKTVDFETTVPASNSRLFTLEISQAAPPKGFRAYNTSTFIEVRPETPVCIDRYCLEENIDTFEASLSDLNINLSDVSENFLGTGETAYGRNLWEEFGTVHEWIDIPNAFELLAASFDLTYTQSVGALPRISLTNRLYDVKHKECENHFVGIAEQIETKFGTFSANERWKAWSYLQSENELGESSKYAKYKDGKDFTYSSIRSVSTSHDISIETNYTNENSYEACISVIDIKPAND